jgi:hypothetical protein
MPEAKPSAFVAGTDAAAAPDEGTSGAQNRSLN